MAKLKEHHASSQTFAIQSVNSYRCAIYKDLMQRSKPRSRGKQTDVITLKKVGQKCHPFYCILYVRTVSSGSFFSFVRFVLFLLWATGLCNFVNHHPAFLNLICVFFACCAKSGKKSSQVHTHFQCSFILLMPAEQRGKIGQHGWMKKDEEVALKELPPTGSPL